MCQIAGTFIPDHILNCPLLPHHQRPQVYPVLFRFVQVSPFLHLRLRPLLPIDFQLSFKTKF